MNCGFIGVGNMAGAILKRMIETGFVPAQNIFALTKHQEKFGINSCSSYEEIIAHSQVLFIGVKPNMAKDLLAEIKKPMAQYRPVLVSMLAGVSLEDLAGMLQNADLPIVRIMPNINAAVGESTTAFCSNEKVNESNRQWIEACLQSFGESFPLAEKDFSVFAAIACCSPAFTYMYIDSLARGALKLGLNKKTALRIAAQSVLGSSKTLLSSFEHPYEWIDKVCSPGGATIEGICTLSESKFDTAIVQAVEACVKKDKFLKG